MSDFDVSLGFDFSRFRSNGWQNFQFCQVQHSMSVAPLNPPTVNSPFLQFKNFLKEQPRPPKSIYNCIESGQQMQGDIQQVLISDQPQARVVNKAKYYTIMKRRVKKVLQEFKLKELNSNHEGNVNYFQLKNEEKQKPKYLYQSRHLHAARRLRGKDGKFIATRPQSQRFRQKKKRGRKPKAQISETKSTILQSAM